MADIINTSNSGDDDQNNSSDFFIEGNHARMSFRKTGEITLTSHKTVSNWCGKLTDVNRVQSLKDKGLRGGDLKEFVTYLALDAKRIKKEVRNHNIKLLSDAGDVGFQGLINKMAGIDNVVELPVPQQNQLAIVLDAVQRMEQRVIEAEHRLTKEERDKEHYKALMYSMYPAKQEYDEIAPCLEKFDLLKPVLKDISKIIKTQGFQFPMSIADLAKEYNLTHGEKINVSRTVASWLKLSSSAEIEEIRRFYGRKKLYPACVKPLVDLAVKVYKR